MRQGPRIEFSEDDPTPASSHHPGQPGLCSETRGRLHQHSWARPPTHAPHTRSVVSYLPWEESRVNTPPQGPIPQNCAPTYNLKLTDEASPCRRHGEPDMGLFWTRGASFTVELTPDGTLGRSSHEGPDSQAMEGLKRESDLVLFATRNKYQSLLL